MRRLCSRNADCPPIRAAAVERGAVLWLLLLALLMHFASAACSPAWAQSAGTKYALLISGLGGDPQYTSRFGTFLNETRTLLTDRYDFPPGQVFVLAEQALADRPFVDGVSTADGIRDYVELLARRAKSDDYVFVFMFGHGSYDGTSARLNIPRQDLADTDFHALLNELNASRLVVVNTTSASGPFAQTLSGTDRIVITATATGTERDETLFPRHFVDALGSAEADLDKNGALSVREAFVYAARRTERAFEHAGQLATEHAQLDDDGDGAPSRLDDVEAGKEGNLAGLTYFRPPRAGEAISEAARPILREKEKLERDVANLKGRKDSLGEDDYYSQLESLFVQLARLNQRLEEGD